MIDAGSVRLRPWREDDLEDLVTACNDPLIKRFLPMLPSPYTRGDAESFVRGQVPHGVEAGGHYLAIADPVTDRLLGALGISYTADATGDIGYWVAPWARRRGAATAATRALSGYAFTHGFSRLSLRTEAENLASQRVALASGYAREGILRGGGRRPDGQRHDLILWARLAGDPPAPTLRSLPDLPGGELTDGAVALRPLCPDDVDDMFALYGLSEVIAGSVPPTAPTRPAMIGYCGRAGSRWLAGERVPLTVRDAPTGAFAGEITLMYTEPSTGQAMIGYSLAREWRGRGFARRAVRLLTEWAFSATPVRRVIAGTTPENLASQRVLQACGFEREGYQRARLPGLNGTRTDDILYALLPPK